MRLNFIFFIILALPFTAMSQHIIYSDAEKKNPSSGDIEVIGKIENNILVSQFINHKYQLQVFDSGLRLKHKINLNFIPAETYRIDFISNSNSCMVIFQSRVKKIINTNIARLNKDGQLLGKIITVDSVREGALNGGELYTVTSSENKKYILFSRRLIGLKPDKLQIEQIILNGNAGINKNEKYFIPFSFQEQFISDLKIDDSGNVIFITYPKPENLTNNLVFYKLPFNSPDLLIKDMAIKKYELKNPRVQINNKNNLFYLASFYQNTVTKNVEGLLSIVLNPDFSDYTAPLVYSFSDSLKRMAEKINNPESAFNNYFLRDIIFREDGSFFVSALLEEKNTATTDYVDAPPSANQIYFLRKRVPNTPNIYSYDKGVVESFNIKDLNSYETFNKNLNSTNIQTKLTTKKAGNVIVFSIDKFNHIFNTTSLSNDPALTPLLPFYQVINTDNKSFFIYNSVSKYNKILLNSLSLQADGNIIANQSLKNLNEGYTFLPELGKQVDTKTMILPCEKNNKVAIGMIHFD